MAYQQGNKYDGQSTNFEWLVMRWIDNMGQDDRNGDIERYWASFLFLIQLVQDYVENERSEAIDSDLQTTQENIETIARSTLTSQEKEEEIRNIKKSVADEMRHHIFHAASRMGYIRREEEASINFDEIDLATVSGMVRHGHVKEKLKQLGIIKQEEKPNETETNNIGQLHGDKKED